MLPVRFVMTWDLASAWGYGFQDHYMPFRWVSDAAQIEGVVIGKNRT